MRAVIPLIAVAAIAGLIVWQAAAARRAGYRLGPETIVRCRDGHLYTTIWIPGGSFKAVRFGMLRFQRCPVDGRWTFATPVREQDLSEQDRQLAAQYRDSGIP